MFGALNKADIVPKAVPMVFASVCFTTVAAMFVALPETWFSSWCVMLPFFLHSALLRASCPLRLV